MGILRALMICTCDNIMYIALEFQRITHYNTSVNGVCCYLQIIMSPYQEQEFKNM